ncbi:site-specific integrase [Tamlana sp. s12]|uniref:site-specific integrase n=1 Tax=Tamlana sp. s12 TaxID=1630406 RepID=UPI00192CBA67|nr:site-specific integrase [Tamlana sp. s12]QQY83363.1 site-specific integrase [Tamlana sp. s12]
MNFNFYLRKDVNKAGKAPVYLHVTSKRKRKRIHLDLYVDPNMWDKEQACLVGPKHVVSDTNLILDNIKSKITDIRTVYKLSSKTLTIDSFIDEFTNEMPRLNFVSFFNRVLEDRKNTISVATYAKERSIYTKLKSYKKEILFCDIDNYFFLKFRNHLAGIGNNHATRNGNVKVLKKYLRIATKMGIKLGIDLDDISVGPTTGNRTYLTSYEVKSLWLYFCSSYIPKNLKIMLGYFLFSCFTGLRISDVLNIKRPLLKHGTYTFTHVKTKKQQVIHLNEKTKDILNRCPELFEIFYSESHINDNLKSIATLVSINKNISFHVARHTFATNFILLGGNVVKLQQLLNHSDIKDTMVYVHLAEAERNTEINLLDKLW